MAVLLSVRYRPSDALEGATATDLFCYHGRTERICYGKYLGHGDAGHIVRITSGSDLMSELGWGRRFGRLPICPEHRAPTDTDWGTKEKP